MLGSTSLSKTAKEVGGALAAAASLTGGAAVLWTGTHDLWAMGFLILVVGLLVAGYVLRSTVKENEELSRKSDELHRRLAETTRAVHEAEGNGAIANYMSMPPFSDDSHRYTLIHEVYVINNQAGNFTWTLQGYNASDEETSAIMLKVAGDTALASDRFSLHGTDVATGAALVVTPVSDQPSIKVRKVAFPVPLGPNETFHIRVSCRWENAFQMTDGDDYVFIPWGSFATRGVERLEGQLYSNVAIHRSTLALLKGAQVVREEFGLPHHRVSADGQSMLSWLIEEPEGLYRVTFSRNAENGS
jgi:hypothetical protein